MSNQTGTKRSNEVMALERRVAQLEALIKQIPSRFPVGKSSDGASIREKITVANTFVAGDVVYCNAGTWAKARANDAVNAAKYSGVIESAVAASFVIVYSGKITLAAAALTPGTTYYLSDTTVGLAVGRGSLTANELKIPVYRAISATTAIVMSARDVGCDLLTLTAGDKTAGGGNVRVNIDATHSLDVGNTGVKYVINSTSGAQFLLTQYGEMILFSGAVPEVRVDAGTAKVALTYPNSHTVTIDSVDMIGTGKIIKMRELSICSDVDGTTKKIMVLCSQEY